MLRYSREEIISNIRHIENFAKRDCFEDIKDFCLGRPQKKVEIIYGLLGTGKTCLMFQVIEKLGVDQCAYIKCEFGDEMSDIYDELDEISQNENNIQYIFIDEITSIYDYIEYSAPLANKYSLTFKIVLSGSYSLAHIFAKDDSLYDRTRTVKTTYIPYYEHRRVLNDEDISSYIRTGGLMHEEILDNDYPFSDIVNIESYTDMAIANNIVYTLEQYDDGTRLLEELKRKGELAEVINKIVNIYSYTANIEDKKTMYENNANILNKYFATKITDKVIIQITNYIEKLDLLHRLKLNIIDDSDPNHVHSIYGENFYITQPGMRYGQSKVLSNFLINSDKFKKDVPDFYDREKFLKCAEYFNLETILKDIVYADCEYVLNNQKYDVFRIKYMTGGEFDLAIHIKEQDCLDIFAISYSPVIDEDQTRWLNDKNKISVLEKCFLPVRNKCVLYQGQDSQAFGAKYKNVTQFLSKIADEPYEKVI